MTINYTAYLKATNQSVILANRALLALYLKVLYIKNTDLFIQVKANIGWGLRLSHFFVLLCAFLSVRSVSYRKLQTSWKKRSRRKRMRMPSQLKLTNSKTS